MYARTFNQVLNMFPNLNELARYIETKPETVHAWKRRNVIPERHWRNIENAASHFGIANISYALLSQIADRHR